MYGDIITADGRLRTSEGWREKAVAGPYTLMVKETSAFEDGCREETLQHELYFHSDRIWEMSTQGLVSRLTDMRGGSFHTCELKQENGSMSLTCVHSKTGSSTWPLVDGKLFMQDGTLYDPKLPRKKMPIKSVEQVPTEQKPTRPVVKDGEPYTMMLTKFQRGTRYETTVQAWQDGYDTDAINADDMLPTSWHGWQEIAVVGPYTLKVLEMSEVDGDRRAETTRHELYFHADRIWETPAGLRAGTTGAELHREEDGGVSLTCAHSEQGPSSWLLSGSRLLARGGALDAPAVNRPRWRFW